MLKVCHVCGELQEHASNRSITCNKCLSTGIKVCSSCGEVKPIKDFYRNGSTLRSACIQCVKKDRRVKRADTVMRAVLNKRSRECHYTSYHTKDDFRRRRIEKSQLRQSNARAVGAITVEEWHDACKAFDFECAYCGSADKLSMEHVVPIKYGGSSAACNIIPCCQHCNSSKGAKDMVEWYTAQPFYSKERLESILKYLESKKGSDA